jgi:hypothetical protein
MMRFMAVLLGATLAVTSSAAAQHAQAREGFWIGFGLGAGSLGFGGDVSGVDRETGLSGYFKLGAAVSPHFLLGAETNGWTKSEGGVTTSAGALSAVGYVYPRATGGLFLKGGLGYLAISDNADYQGSASGLAAQLGVGYDVRVGSNFSLTPYANYLASSGAELKIDGSGVGANINPNVFQFGLGVTWH